MNPKVLIKIQRELFTINKKSLDGISIITDGNYPNELINGGSDI